MSFGRNKRPLKSRATLSLSGISKRGLTSAVRRSSIPQQLTIHHLIGAVLGLLGVAVMGRVLLDINMDDRLFKSESLMVTVVQWVLLLVLPLAVGAYIVIDFIAHRNSLLAGKPRVIKPSNKNGVRSYDMKASNRASSIKSPRYSLLHHLRVVNMPMFMYRFKHSFVTVLTALVYLIGFSGFLGYMIVRDSNAAPGVLTVSINQKAGTTDPNPSYTSVFTVVFSEAIDKASFTETDLTLGGSAPGQAVQSITETTPFDQTTFEVRVQATGAGTIQPSVIAESVAAFIPSSGTNQASTSTDNQVTYNGAYAPDEFVTIWKTDNTGASSSNQISIPTTDGGYSFNVDWGDGTVSTTAVTHTYASAGTYTVKISGSFPRIFFNNSGDRRKILDVKQWGSNSWSNMGYAFAGATNLNFSAVDAPNLSSATNLGNMLAGSTSFNSNINHWDVSNIDSFNGVFTGAAVFNQPLSEWDMSSAWTIGGMFQGASVFNQPLNDWDTSNVTVMSSAFTAANKFNQPLNKWNTSNVTAMLTMFTGTTAGAMDFNQSLADWDVSNVLYMTDFLRNSNKMSVENYDATLISWSQQPLKNNVTFSGGSNKYCQSESARQSMITSKKWNITDGGKQAGCVIVAPERPFIIKVNTNLGESSSTDYLIPASDGHTYNYRVDCNNDGVIDKTSRTTNTTCEYGSAGVHEIAIYGTYPHWAGDAPGAQDYQAKIVDVVQWGDIAWSSMGRMFESATSLTSFSASDSPKLSAVTDMSHMFNGASSFNGDVHSWEMQNVQDMSYMFSGATNFNKPLNDWTTSSATDMSGVFNGAYSFNQPLSSWATGNVSSMDSMFRAAGAFEQSIASWNLEALTSALNIFTDSGMSTENYDAALLSWSVQTLQSGVTFDAGASKYCNAESERQSMIDNFGWTINDSGKDCEDSSENGRPFIIKIDSTLGWNPGSMRITLDNSYDHDVDIDCNNDGVIEYYDLGLIADCYYPEPGIYEIAIHGDLKSWYGDKSDNDKIIDIVQWGDMRWVDMMCMLCRTEISTLSAEDAPDLSRVENMSGMFQESKNFNSDINHWDVSNVTNMSAMFQNAEAFNQPIDSWDVSNVTTMQFMFGAALQFNQPLNNWNTQNLVDMSFMFTIAPSFDQPLNNWDVSNVEDMMQVFGNYVEWYIHYVEDNVHGLPYSEWSQEQKDNLFEIMTGAIGFEITEENYQSFTPGLSTPNYDATLQSWASQSLQEDVVFDAGTSTYCNAEAERQSIIDTFGWAVNDSGKDCESLTYDISLFTSISAPSAIKTGDNLSYTTRLTNLGPGVNPFTGDTILAFVIPEDTSFVSASGIDTMDCQSGSLEDFSAPFASHYPSRTMVLCFISPSPSTVVNIEDYVSVVINLVSSKDFSPGEDVGIKSLVLPSGEVDTYTISSQFGSGVDPFILEYNNISNYTFTLPTATDPGDEDDDDDDTPTNPGGGSNGGGTNPPGPSTPSTPTTPGTPGGGTGGPRTPVTPSPSGGGVDVTPDLNEDLNNNGSSGSNPLTGRDPLSFEDFNLDKPEEVKEAKAVWPTRIPTVFTSLLGLLALLYGYLAFRDYRRAKAAQALLTRFRKDKENIQCFLEIVSHYLGTPLSILKGSTELMESKNVLAAVTLGQLKTDIGALDTVVAQTQAETNAALAAATATEGTARETSILSLAKAKQVWLPLVVVAVAVVLVDILLLTVGGYQFAALRMANTGIFFILGVLAIALTSFLMVRQKQIAKERRDVIAVEQQLSTQQQTILGQVALEIQAIYGKLTNTSGEFKGIAGTELYFNGLGMLAKLSQSLSRASAFATPVAGNLPLQSLTNVVQSAVSSLQNTAAQKNITVQTNVPSNLAIRAGQDEAHFMVSSILENALSFSPQDSTVSITGAQDSKHVTLTISDQGSGIPKETIDNIFKPFSRGTDTKTYDHEGLGLGLYTNKLLVERLGGELKVEGSSTAQQPETGTTVKITLPPAPDHGTGLSSNITSPGVM